MKAALIALSFLGAVASARSVYSEKLHYARIFPRQTADNLQTFTGDLGAAADAITFSGDNTRPFLVNGDTFVNFAAAAQRTCDIQFNACADAANSGAAFSVSDCSAQETQCDAAQSAATITSFSGAATAVTTTAAASTGTTAAVAVTNCTGA